MSRFQPDSVWDALQLPLAMLQFRGNVYVEPIAPDARPVAFAFLFILACAVTLGRMWCRSRHRQPEQPASVQHPGRRAAWALSVATFVAMCAWIWTSANGRYGLLALTLSPLAAWAALRLVVVSPQVLVRVLAVLLSVQGLFLLTADPDDTWSRLTLYRWNERYADRLPPAEVEPWKVAANGRNVLVVTTKTLTGMSTLYPVFGSQAHYMGLAYLDGHLSDSPERARANQLIDKADEVFWSGAVAAEGAKKNVLTNIPSPITSGDRKILSRFGLAGEVDTRCSLLPDRLGGRIQICPLKKAGSKREERETELPREPLRVLRTLIGKCPRRFGEPRPPISDSDGGVTTAVGDGKYYLKVKENLSVYLQHRNEISESLLASSKQAQRLSEITCHDILPTGMQYWR